MNESTFGRSEFCTVQKIVQDAEMRDEGML